MNQATFTLEIPSREEFISREKPARGEAGVLGSEFCNSPKKFGRSPRNRIGELRKEGCLISGKPHGAEVEA
jgi:hypothetical protein